jgi:hypothetical protein
MVRLSTKSSKDRKHNLEEVTKMHHRTLRRGWCLSGPGPARFGWYGETAAGDRKFYGRTIDKAHDELFGTEEEALANAYPNG